MSPRRLILAPILLGASISFSACVPLGVVDAASSSTSGVVVAVVDGDTIDVDTGSGAQRVRIIGIDTPEIGRGGKTDECYAREAREILDELIIYRSDVKLITDPTQSDVDRYGRLLRHVHHEGRSVALTLIEAGAGYEHTYDAAYDGQEAHRAAQDAAERDGRGLWVACAAGGGRSPRSHSLGGASS